MEPVSYYSPSGGLIIAIPETHKTLGGQRLHFTPMGMSFKKLSWGSGQLGILTTFDSDVAAFLEERRLKGSDIMNQEQFNVEFNISAKGARTVIEELRAEISDKNRLMAAMQADGRLDANGKATGKGTPPEVIKAQIAADSPMSKAEIAAKAKEAAYQELRAADEARRTQAAKDLAESKPPAGAAAATK